MGEQEELGPQCQARLLQSPGAGTGQHLVDNPFSPTRWPRLGPGSTALPPWWGLLLSFKRRAVDVAALVGTTYTDLSKH